MPERLGAQPTTSILPSEDSSNLNSSTTDPRLNVNEGISDVYAPTHPSTILYCSWLNVLILLDLARIGLDLPSSLSQYSVSGSHLPWQEKRQSRTNLSFRPTTTFHDFPVPLQKESQFTEMRPSLGESRNNTWSSSGATSQRSSFSLASSGGNASCRSGSILSHRLSRVGTAEAQQGEEETRSTDKQSQSPEPTNRMDIQNLLT